MKSRQESGGSREASDSRTDLGSRHLRLDGRVALVTGAAQGIGAAIADRMAAAGARVFRLDRDPSATPDSLRCNVSDVASLREAVGTVLRNAGRLDILVNNAGVGSHTPPHDLTPEEFDWVTAINARGALFASQLCYRPLADAGGSIVSVSSIAAVGALGRGNLAYSMSKAAIEAMTRELAVEWARSDIRVNAVAPCQVHTPGFDRLLADPDLAGGRFAQRTLEGIPLGRLAHAEEVAAAVHFLASDAAAFITGVVLPVDGGNLALNAGGSIGSVRSDMTTSAAGPN